MIPGTLGSSIYRFRERWIEPLQGTSAIEATNLRVSGWLDAFSERVKRGVHSLFRSGEQVTVAVEHRDHRGAPGSRCDLLRCGAGGDPESNRGMPEIVRPKGSDPRCLCRGQSEPPTPTRETNRAAGWCREYKAVGRSELAEVLI